MGTMMEVPYTVLLSVNRLKARREKWENLVLLLEAVTVILSFQIMNLSLYLGKMLVFVQLLLRSSPERMKQLLMNAFPKIRHSIIISKKEMVLILHLHEIFKVESYE